MGVGMLDTSTVILLGRIADPATLPDQSVISAITLAELTIGPQIAADPAEGAARQAHLQQAENDFDAIAFDARLLDVHQPVERREALTRDALAGVEYGIKGLAPVLSKARPARQLLSMQPVVEKEIQGLAHVTAERERSGQEESQGPKEWTAEAQAGARAPRKFPLPPCRRPRTSSRTHAARRGDDPRSGRGR